MSRRAIGIDFGTSFCRAAVQKDSTPEIISIRFSEGGVSRVPEYIEKVKQAYSFHGLKQKIGIRDNIQINGETVVVHDVASDIFAAIKDDATNFLKDDIFGAVVTVPSCFAEKQRAAIRKAAEDGGFETVKLLDESVAAILATGIKEEGKVLLVYVMGAGVFTASVIKIVNGVPSALWHEGERRLGGNNFDEIIVRHLLETLHLDAQAFNSSPITIPKLKQIAEKAKIELSKRETVDLSSAIRDLFSADPEFQFPENVILDRMAFEGMIADHINHTVQLTERALEKAKVMPQDIGSIMLLGGSTKIPLIEKVIHEKFGLKVRRGSDALIVTGAAIHSARALTPIKKIPEKTEPQAPKKPQARKPPEPIEKHSWLKMFEPKLISAHHAWQQGEQKQAITVMEEHLDEISQFIAHLYFTRGEYLFKKEDYNQAIAHFQKGLKLDNDIHRIHKSYHLACNRYALQLFNKGLPHEAKNVIKIGVQLDPSCKACLGLRNNINAAISKQPGLVGIRKKGKKKRK